MNCLKNGIVCEMTHSTFLLQPGREVIKVVSCSTQLSIKLAHKCGNSTNKYSQLKFNLVITCLVIMQFPL